jgi:hypothetical protein
MTARVEWTKRRARRLQEAFGISRRHALLSANEDWRAFVGRTQAEVAPRRPCNELGLCQVEAAYAFGLAPRLPCAECTACQPPRTAPTFAPGVIDGPQMPRTGWRAALRDLGRWLMGPSPW